MYFLYIYINKRGVILQYKIRVIKSAQLDKKYSPIFGVTIPQHIAEQLSGVLLTPRMTAKGLLLESGALPSREVLWHEC